MTLNRRDLLKVSAAATTFTAAPWIIRKSRAADEILIGELHDLSGVIDLYGTAFHEGFTLAVEETNEAGGLLGRPIRVITYDTQSNNQLYAQYAQQTALQDQVAVVHGGITQRLARGHPADPAPLQHAVLLQQPLRGRRLRPQHLLHRPTPAQDARQAWCRT